MRSSLPHRRQRSATGLSRPARPRGPGGFETGCETLTSFAPQPPEPSSALQPPKPSFAPQPPIASEPLAEGERLARDQVGRPVQLRDPAVGTPADAEQLADLATGP